MKLFGWEIRKSAAYDSLAHHPSFISNLSGDDAADIPASKLGYLRAYRESVWVRRCVDVIANNIASTPPMLVKIQSNGVLKTLRDHPILDLLRDVNELELNSIDLMRRTATHINVFGDCFWYVTLSPVGTPLEIFTLEPLYTEPIPATAPEKFVQGFRHDTRGSSSERVRIYPPEQVCWFKLDNPTDPYHGLSRVHSIRRYVSSDLHASSWNASWFKRAVSTSDRLLLGEPMTPEQRSEIEMVLERRHGYGKWHQVLVAGGPGIKYEESKAVGKDADWTDLSRQNRDAICAGLGVPVFMVSGNDSSRYDTADPQKISFWEETILPDLRWMAEVLTWNLIPLYPDLEASKWQLTFDLDAVPVLKDAKMFRYQKVREVTGTPPLTPNEARLILNMPNVEGGDEIPIPSNMISLSSIPEFSKAVLDNTKSKSSPKETGDKDTESEDTDLMPEDL